MPNSDFQVSVYLRPRSLAASKRDRLRLAYTGRLPAAWRARTPDLLAEALFWAFRATEDAGDSLDSAEQKLNRSYRGRRLPPLSVGDVVAVGGQAFMCGPFGRALAMDSDQLRLRLADDRPWRTPNRR